MLAGIFVNLHYIVDVTVFSEDKAVYYQLLRRSHAYYPCDIRKIKFKKMKHHNLYYFYSKNRKSLPAFVCIIDNEQSLGYKFLKKCDCEINR